MLRRTIPALLLLILAVPALAQTPPRYLGITLLTTNDLHANLVPYDRAPNPATNYPGVKDIGGAARRATVIRKIRAEVRTPVLLLDSGDTAFGYTKLAKAYHGKADIAAMNAIGYDAMVPGNHDFQWPGEDTARNLKDSKFPWICANVVYEKTGKLFCQPYIIRDVWGVRVAIFGLTNELPRNVPKQYRAAPELGLTVLPPAEVAAKLVPELRQKADIVIFLSHLGRGGDTNLVQKVPGIDIVLGGHSHSRLAKPDMVQVGQPSAFYLGTVPVVQAGAWGPDMGDTRVIFRRDAQTGRYALMSCKGRLIPINNTIPDDPQIAGLIRRFDSQIKPPPPAPPKPAAAPGTATTPSPAAK